MLEPAIARLAVAFGGPIDVLTRSGHAPLIALMPHARMVSRVWLRRYDAVFAYDALNKTTFHAFTSLAPRKELLLRATSEQKPLHARIFHALRAPGLNDRYLAEYNWANTPGENSAYRPPSLNIPPNAWGSPTTPTENFLVLNSTAGWKAKRWKVSAWTEVVRQLLDHGVPRVILTSGSEDWQIEHAGRIAEKLADPRVTFLGGQTALPEFLHLISRAHLVLGVDGAAAHLANAFGGRSLTLFFQTNVRNWHSPSPSSRAIAADPQPDGSLTIPTTAVLDAAWELWQSRD